IFEDDNNVIISALNKNGFDRLLSCIMKNLPETAKRMKLIIPYENTSFISRIRNDGKIFAEEYTETGTLIDALVDIKLIKEAEKYLI
ncbi:MAG: GTPase HflX, partial [Ruminococcus sp.]|nr:GTPase HflX [Ruminococcus sp.]